MKKVALGIEINNNAGRGILGGILKYVSNRSQWHVRLFSHPETLSVASVRRLKADGVEGLIVNHVGDEATARELKSLLLPVSFVDVDHPLVRRRKTKTAFVGNRNDVVGALGARKFLSLGKFRSFAFVSHPDGPAWSEARQEGFCAELRRHGLESVRLADDVAAGLLRLPRPTAVMAAWDYKAIEVLETCRELGLRVPEDVSVIGVDADPLICGFTNPSLSSVAPDFERLGYCAAAALDAMMAGRKTKAPNEIRCRPRELIERASTRFLPPAAALLHQAKEIVERDAVRGLTVRDLAMRLGVSQQLLSLRFRQYEKCSAQELILATRLARVKELLTRTDRNFAAVARACGFRSANRLAHFFKERVGLSLGDYARRQSRRAGKQRSAKATASESAPATA